MEAAHTPGLCQAQVTCMDRLCLFTFSTAYHDRRGCLNIGPPSRALPPSVCHIANPICVTSLGHCLEACYQVPCHSVPQVRQRGMCCIPTSITA
jgi:hypothetical protein